MRRVSPEKLAHRNSAKFDAFSMHRELWFSETCFDEALLEAGTGAIALPQLAEPGVELFRLPC
jgi:hypothetical protein